MVYHVMSDGTKRDTIKGVTIPKDISKSIIYILKEKQDGNCNKTGTIREK